MTSQRVTCRWQLISPPLVSLVSISSKSYMIPVGDNLFIMLPIKTSCSRSGSPSHPGDATAERQELLLREQRTTSIPGSRLTHPTESDSTTSTRPRVLVGQHTGLGRVGGGGTSLHWLRGVSYTHTEVLSARNESHLTRNSSQNNFIRTGSILS